MADWIQNKDTYMELFDLIGKDLGAAWDSVVTGQGLPEGVGFELPEGGP